MCRRSPRRCFYCVPAPCDPCRRKTTRRRTRHRWSDRQGDLALLPRLVLLAKTRLPEIVRCLRPPPWASARVSLLIAQIAQRFGLPEDVLVLRSAIFLLYLSVDETTTTCVSVRQPFHLYHLRDHFMRCMAKILQLLQAPGGIFRGRLVLGAFLELRFFSIISGIHRAYSTGNHYLVPE
jgi:hypothetical protein